MKTVLITGGAGYVGSILLRRLLDAQYHVVCVDKLMFGGESLVDIWENERFAFYNCDITDFETFGAILKKEKPWAVCHLAAIVGDPACKRESDLARKTNWEASKFLLESSLDLGAERFVFASTCSNYGKMPDSDGFVEETSPLAPVSLYAELKVRFEELMLNEIPKTDSFCPVSLRFATVYGLSHRMRFDLTVNEFTKEIALGKELEIYGEQFWRPYCHVRDFSRAFLNVLEAPRDKVAYDVFNVGDTNENYTKKMIATEILKQIPEGRIKYVQKNEDPRDYRVSFEKIKSRLGFTISKTVPEGIREVRDIVALGVIPNPEAQRYYNIPH
jgi:nucleoside-diphosphate-sugar epimerase